jgi:hypothetical protein
MEMSAVVARREDLFQISRSSKVAMERLKDSGIQICGRGADGA